MHGLVGWPMKLVFAFFWMKMWILFVATLLLVSQQCDGAVNYKFGGTFLYTQSITQAQLPAYFNEIQSLGMDTVIVQFTRRPGTCGDINSYTWSTPLTYISQMLTVANSYNIGVYIGLALTFDICSIFYQQPNIASTAQDSANSVAAILALGNFPALKGWYVPDEPGLAGWDMPSLTYGYYSAVTAAIKSKSVLPVLVSPYLVGLNGKTPQLMASRALDFKTNTGIDIQVWQDSVGAVAVNIYNRLNQPTLADYYSNISAAIGKAGFWSDLEAYNYGTDLTAVSGGYRACSSVRLYNQLQSTSPYVSKSTTWIQQIHFGTVDSLYRKPESLRLFNSYLSTLFSFTTAAYITPLSYVWNTAPSASYSDSTPPSKMFNKATADPLNYADTQWVGILGNAEAVVDFGKQVKTQWVGVHFLASSGAGIAFPSSLTIYCSNSSASSWVNLASLSLPFTQKFDGEYVFGNTSPLPSISARYLRLVVANIQWTFASEVEIVGV